MTIARQYIMVATEARAAALGEALADLEAKVRGLEGCEGVEIMQDIDSRDRFVFVERWVSVEAHRAAGKTLGREAFAPVSACLVKPPEACYLDCLSE